MASEEDGPHVREAVANIRAHLEVRLVVVKADDVDLELEVFGQTVQGGFVCLLAFADVLGSFFRGDSMRFLALQIHEENGRLRGGEKKQQRLQSNATRRTSFSSLIKQAVSKMLPASISLATALRRSGTLTSDCAGSQKRTRW